MPPTHTLHQLIRLASNTPKPKQWVRGAAIRKNDNNQFQHTIWLTLGAAKLSGLHPGNRPPTRSYQALGKLIETPGGSQSSEIPMVGLHLTVNVWHVLV